MKLARPASMLVLLCMAILLIPSAQCFAQSAEDTALWLQTKLVAATTSEHDWYTFKVTPDQISFEDYEHSNTNNPYRKYTVAFHDVTSVSFRPPCRESNCIPVLVLTFKPVFGDEKKEFSLISATVEDTKRIVKALQHLARVNGAKIVDDNLF